MHRPAQWLSTAAILLPPVLCGAQGSPIPPSAISPSGGFSSAAEPGFSVNSNGELIVTHGTVSVCVSRSTVVEFRPQPDDPQFKPDSYAIYLQSHLAATRAKADTGSENVNFRMRLDKQNFIAEHVRVTGWVQASAPVTIIRAHLFSGSSDAPSLAVANERLILGAGKGSKPASVYLFLKGEFVGRTTGRVAGATLDARPLAPGDYDIWAVPQEADGSIGLPVDEKVTIAPRYSIVGMPASELTVAAGHEGERLPLRISCAPSCGAARTRLFLDGDYVAQGDGSAFLVQLPLDNVPSGRATLSLVGVGPDGQRYAKETYTFAIDNEPWMARVGSSAEYQEILANEQQMAQAEQQMEQALAEASHEPEYSQITNDQYSKDTNYSDIGTDISVTNSTQTYQANNKLADDLGNARKALVQMAQLQLQNGELYAGLKLYGLARDCFNQVISEMDATTTTGAKARSDLDNLPKED